MERRFLTVLFVILALVATLQSILLPSKYVRETGYAFPHYNNYLIFKQSFFHLVDHKDLYAAYPSEHWDYFKYTPTFSLLFAPMALLPDAIGLPVWHLLNSLLLLFAIYTIPGLSLREKGWITLAGSIEMMTGIQNEQSNGLITALILFAFGFCEQKKFLPAVLCLMLSVFIKPFGIVGFSILAFYPNKWRHVGYSILAGVVLFALPLLVTSPEGLIRQYQSWLHLLSADHAGKYGLSVIGWLHSWFAFDPDKTLVTLTGAALFLLPFLRFRMYDQPAFRILALASILIWVVIFNHMAESPTFILAMTGASVWYFASKSSWLRECAEHEPVSVHKRKRMAWDTTVYIFVFAFVSLTATDLVPKSIRNEWIKPYVLKAVPCIMLWIWLVVEMMRMKRAHSSDAAMQTFI